MLGIIQGVLNTLGPPVESPLGLITDPQFCLVALQLIAEVTRPFPIQTSGDTLDIVLWLSLALSIP